MVNFHRGQPLDNQAIKNNGFMSLVAAAGSIGNF